MAEDYEIVENSSDTDYSYPKIDRQSIRDALASIDAQRTSLQIQKDFGLDEATFGYGTFEGKDVEVYGSRYQREQSLKKTMEDDMMYSSYFSKRYGNMDVYFNLDELYYPKAYNPLSDSIVSVKIAKEGKVYVADHINPNQIIEELIEGIVSFLVIKVNGQVARIMGTLKAELVNGEDHVRQAAFSLLPDGRILLWNTMKEKWSSFYPDNLLEMTRDDTTDFE
jgi:hypothetical protein